MLYALAVDPEGRLQTAAGGGLKVRRWDIETGEAIFSHDERRQLLGLTLSEDGDFLAIVTARDQVEVRDLRSNTRIAGPLAGNMPIVLSTGGRLLAVNEHASGAWVWDL